MLSKQAFNGLLKTLEEPPQKLKFILATTESRKIPVTILSRCQRFDLKRVSLDKITKHLKQILEIAVFYNSNLYVEIKAAEVERVMRLVNSYNLFEKCLFWSEDKKIMKDIINSNFKINYMLRRQDFKKLNDITERYKPQVIEYTINDDLEELQIVKENKIQTMIAYMGSNAKIFEKIIKLRVDYVNIDQPILFSKLYKKQLQL